MKIEQRQVGTVDVLTPVGALVEGSAAEFSSRLLQRVRSPNARLVISLQDVPYVDSAALEGLVAAAAEMAERAACLTLASLSQTCRETLELTGLASRFRIFKDVQDAVKSFL